MTDTNTAPASDDAESEGVAHSPAVTIKVLKEIRDMIEEADEATALDVWQKIDVAKGIASVQVDDDSTGLSYTLQLVPIEAD